MTRVKICGITNRDDAVAAVELGANALGFIFVPGTPRYIGRLPNLLDLLACIPPFVTRVGVCVHPDQVVPEALEHLDILQTYDHTSQYSRRSHPSIVPAFRIRDMADLDQIGPAVALYHARAILLDAKSESSLGGAGETFDWQLAIDAQARCCAPLILAGGLTPDNVGAAILKVRPFAVDVSSGVEAEGTADPPRKDHHKIRAFIREVRLAE